MLTVGVSLPSRTQTDRYRQVRTAGQGTDSAHAPSDHPIAWPLQETIQMVRAMAVAELRSEAATDLQAY